MSFRILNFSMLIIHFTLFSLLSAGAPDTLWTRTYGGANADFGYSVQQTSDGGFVIAGYTESFGAESSNVYLIKTDANGDTLWTKTYGGDSLDIGYSVKQTNDGGFIIAGETMSFGVGKRDVYIIRTNSTGDTLWTKMYGGNENDIGYSMQKTYDGGFIIAGTANAFNIIGGEAYLIRTNSSGDTAWTKTYGRKDSIVFVYELSKTSDGGYIITGYSDHGDPYIPSDDVYLIRTDSLGDTLWTKIYGGTNEDYGHSVQQTNDGGFVIAGYTNSSNIGTFSLYLIRTNSNGDTLWTKAYCRDNYYIRGRSVKLTKEGGFIIAGVAYYFDSTGSEDIYLIRTNPNGDTLWTRSYGGPKDDLCHSLEQTSDGGYIIVGWTKSFGDTLGDVYLVRLDKDTTGIQEEIPSNFLNPNNLIVSYNHGNISIHYNIPYSTSVKLEAYDTKGKLVKVIQDKFMQKGSYSVNWDSKRFGSGVYYIKLSSGNNSLIQKAIILR